MFVTRWGCSPIQSWGRSSQSFLVQCSQVGLSLITYLCPTIRVPLFPHQHHCQPSHSGSGSGPQQICWLLPTCLQTFWPTTHAISWRHYPWLSAPIQFPVYLSGEAMWFQTPWWSKSTEVQCLVLLLTFRDSNAAVAMSSMVLFSPERRWKPCLPQKCEENSSSSYYGSFFPGSTWFMD